MHPQKLMKLSIRDLEKLDESHLRQTWADIRDHCSQFDQPRRLWGKEDRRDADYYHLQYMQTVAFLILFGKYEWRKPFSMADAGASMMTFFEGANEGRVHEHEVREFLEYLLSFKQAYRDLEYEVDVRLLRIVDECEGIAAQTYENDPDSAAWYENFIRFAKGLRHRSRITLHGEQVGGYILAERLKDLYYDKLAEFVGDLAYGIEEDAKKDRERGRTRLADALESSVHHLKKAQEALEDSWRQCKPHTDLNKKRYGTENIFDPEITRRAKVGQFVHSYMLTLRMHNETGEAHYLSLLKGMDYKEECRKDPDFEAMIEGLLDGFELMFAGYEKEMAEVEAELNALIGRDVWCYR